jgi:hypothetical protein
MLQASGQIAAAGEAGVVGHVVGLEGGGVNVASGDVNDDGVTDIKTGPGAGGGPNVSVFDGAHLPGLLNNFMAFDPGFLGGVYVG